MSEIKITRCPSRLSEGWTTFSTAARKELFGGVAVSHILPFELPSSGGGDGKSGVTNAGRLSLSGAQSKFGLLLDGDMLRYSRADEQSEYIMKPRPRGYQIINQEYCAANENLTMQLASQVYGLETAANGLCFFADGEAAYITRRFDVRPGGKYAQEDFASLMGLTRANGGSDFKYVNASYEECGEIISRYVKAARVDLLRFFKVILFNFVSLNDDAHLKNFSLVGDGVEYRLSPAYDLVNTSLQIYTPRIFALDKGLFREGMTMSDVNHIGARDFAELGRRLGLPGKVVDKEIARFSASNPEADMLIGRSYLSDELKKLYYMSFHHRQVLLRP